MTFYTDSRSKKILHIKENNKVSLLLYHPDKLMQLRIEGLAIRERDEEVLQAHWSRVEGGSQKDFTTTSAPGTEILNPEHQGAILKKGRRLEERLSSPVAFPG